MVDTVPSLMGGLSENLDLPTIGRSLELPVLPVNVCIMPERERVDEY